MIVLDEEENLEPELEPSLAENTDEVEEDANPEEVTETGSDDATGGEEQPLEMQSPGSSRGIADKLALKKLFKIKVIVIAAVVFAAILIVAILFSKDMEKKYDYLAPQCASVNVHFEHGSKEDFTLPLEKYVESLVYSLTKEMANPNRVLYQAIAVAVRTNAQNLDNCTLNVDDEVTAYYDFEVLQEGNSRYTEISYAVEYVKGLVMVQNNNFLNVNFDSFCYKSNLDGYYTLHNDYNGPKVPSGWAQDEITNELFRDCPCTPNTKRSSRKVNKCWVEEKYPPPSDDDEEEKKIYYLYVDGGDQGEGLSVYTAYYLAGKPGYHDEHILRFFYPSKWEYYTVDTDNANDGSDGLGFAINGSGCMWWPIGSNETSSHSGVVFANGAPASTRITSSFGTRDLPTAGATTVHNAIDIGGPTGGYPEGIINIIAAASGTVTRVVTGCVSSGNRSCGGGLGNAVYIKHDDGTETRYGHLYSVSVTSGSKVIQGQVIGKMGNTGTSTGTHLDFQVKVNGTVVNPLNYVSASNPRSQCSTIADVASGNNNAQTICLTFKNLGYSDYAIAGIMGNLNAESTGFRTVNTNSIGCDGIAQWCQGRLTNLKSTYGSSWSSINSQVQYIIYELNTGYRGVNNYLKGSSNETDVAYYFCMNYEIPGEAECSKGNRQNYARDFLSYVRNGCQ